MKSTTASKSKSMILYNVGGFLQDYEALHNRRYFCLWMQEESMMGMSYTSKQRETKPYRLLYM
jgi:hypothetical protein